MTGTRLDRLFLLLENGSTRVIRKSAAEQLGEVQKLHPHELHNLLTKLHPYLVHEAWDTRIAASQAIEAIAKNVPQWSPKPVVKKEEADIWKAKSSQLSLDQFDVGKVLSQAASLLASEGAEFDPEEDINLDQKEKLARQKELLNKRLGLDESGRLGVGAGELFHEEDLVMTRDQGMGLSQTSVRDVLSKHVMNIPHADGLSSRELNRVKRKAKQLAKQTSRDDSRDGEASDSEPGSKLRKMSSVLVNQPSDDKILMDTVPSSTLDLDQMDEWPFTGFCDVLMNELFNCCWEKRHGAAIGLREVVRLHGAGGGLTAHQTALQQTEASMCWLEDLAVRLICVIALDRFGDFVSDEVVAPVRESCAQTLGAVIQLLLDQRVVRVAYVLVQLLSQPQWEVRHGGLLGLKYLLAIKKDLQEQLLPDLLPVMFRGLQDHSDDVRAVSAASLVPVTDTLLSPTLLLQVSSIVDCLWSTLLDLDDLTSSTNSIMTLLTSLLAKPALPDNCMSSKPLHEMVSRLWPFLRHNIMSVRKAALQTLHTLLSRQQQHGGYAMWLVPVLQDAMRHIYQRSLLEQCQEVIELVEQVWCLILECSSLDHLVAASSPWLGVWLCLMMQPANLPFDPSLLVEAKHSVKDQNSPRVQSVSTLGSPLSENAQTPTIQKDYIGGSHSLSDHPVHRDIGVMSARLAAARLVGRLCARFSQPGEQVMAPESESPSESMARLLLFHLNSKSGLQRMCIGFILTHWARVARTCPLCDQPCPVIDTVKLKLHECLNTCIYFDEIALSFTKMQTECQDFIACLKQAGIPMDQFIQSGSVLSLDQATSLCSTVFDSVKSQIKPRQLTTFEERRRCLQSTVSETSAEHNLLSIRVQVSLAAAVIELEDLPDKMNPVVRPLMECLKKEMNPDLQKWTAVSLAHLLDVCHGRTPCPNTKIIKNLSTMLCADPHFTPALSSPDHDTFTGILALNTQQGIEVVSGKGRRPATYRQTLHSTVDVSLDSLINSDDDEKKQRLLQRRGATYALTTITGHSDLLNKLTSLWDILTVPFNTSHLTGSDEEVAQQLVNSLQVLQVVGPHLQTSLLKHLQQRCLEFYQCLCHKYTSVRHMAARCLAMMCLILAPDTMNFILDTVLPALGGGCALREREGAMEALTSVVDELGVGIVPYIVLLMVPVLGCVGEQTESLRLMATQCFASLIRLMPLEGGVENPPGMSSHLVEQKEQERRFLEQLLDGSKVDNYSIPVPIQAELRTYQQDGVNWLSFLNRYKLHGILCDDMGLGKTLMSLCILAGDHHQAMLSNKSCGPSIVICPPTLMGHWMYEAEKFVSTEHLNPLHYAGTPTDRLRLQRLISNHNLVVSSYDIVRNDIEFFSSIKWNYCILDEGHIIKNSKTKLSQAVKRLESSHRLILSGTPIQNSVLELWSLFDFLMPGFLGTERQFQVRYGRPILQSRDAKSSSKDQEAGALAMEALHRQVLPFILRRLKENVLKDLPPKIIQDYFCDLSPLQVQLYEDFAKSRARQTMEDSIGDGDVKPSKEMPRANIFQALQYLKRLCNHPALVLNPQHPRYTSFMSQLRSQKSKLRSLEHAPKLCALQQLLTDCGIGVPASDSVVNQHRALVFCQLKSMLDILETDLLKSHMPDVTYLRLDGSVPASNRHGLVNRFNNDPSIDLLLLTTHVGGLGLNLTGADTVIFVEHDWNPTKDLQAMDRAHRIGQKKVVNVYRLITRGTLEEKIMGLQKFKLNIANTVISQENSSIASMGTDQLLDLFSLDDSPKKSAQSDKSQASGKITLQGILEGSDQLWDVDQYESELDLGKFMETLAK